ncbi:MAG: cytochrome c [Pseudomonadota bacterium]
MAETPQLGEPVSAETLELIDFTVFPDGEGLPPGSGTAAEGLVIYQTQCRVCHGEGGEGGPNDRLVGGQGSLASGEPVKTIGSYWPYATTLFDYLRRAMPHQAPGSLDNDALYALSAYLLFENNIIDRDTPMNAETLPGVEMPNREGFTPAWPPSED